MSENDTLPEADGKKEVDQTDTTPKDDALAKAEDTPEVESDTTDAAQENTPQPEAESATTDTTEATKVEPEVEGITAATTKDAEPEAEVDAKDAEDDNSTSSVTTQEEDAEAHAEIEASNAEDAEDEGNVERHEVEEKDYHSMSLQDLATELNRLLKHHKIQTISKQVNQIKAEFNAKFNQLLEEKKEEFLNDGGNEIDFYYTNDAKKLFNQLYKDYKQAINTYYKEREQNLKQNLDNRLGIIEEIKGLLNVEENINTTYKHFKDLQEKWRNAGPIPRDKYNNAWNTYHHHVERFYDFLHLNNDLRDMDFKHNYEQKLKIIERAEDLVKDDNINRTFRELQVLHKLWKEELGPVAKEHREEIWERFSKATKTIHDKRQAYYADLDKAYEKNLEKKEDIIAKIQAIADDSANSHGAWQKKIREVEALRESFFTAGKVPLKVNEATWAKFKDTVRSFNRGKNKFYKELKKDQYENLQKKRELIKIAEENKDSDDFEVVTPLMKKIQSDWKKIGHVPRRDSDKIWKQFKDACNYYFDRMHAQRKAENQHLYDAFDKKVKLLEELKAMTFSGDNKADVEALKARIADWKAVGYVPQNKRYIDGKFYKAIDDAFDQLKMDKSKLDMVKFESKLENLANNDNDTRLLDNEQNFIRKKIGEVQSEITQLENNLQFFSNVDETNPLVKDVLKNIDKHKKALETWKAKLAKIRGMYN